MHRLSQKFAFLKEEYMKMTDKKNVNDFILKQIQTLEEDYEIGLK